MSGKGRQGKQSKKAIKASESSGDEQKEPQTEDYFKQLESDTEEKERKEEHKEEEEEIAPEYGETKHSNKINYFFVDDLVNKMNFKDPARVPLTCLGFFDNTDTTKDKKYECPIYGTDKTTIKHLYKFYIYCVRSRDEKSKYKPLHTFNFEFPKLSNIGVSVFLDEEDDAELIKEINSQEIKQFYEFNFTIRPNKKEEYGKYKINIDTNKYIPVNKIKIRNNNTEYNNKLLYVFNKKPNLSIIEINKHFEKLGPMASMEELLKDID